MPALNKGRAGGLPKACGSAATPRLIQIQKITELSINFPPVDWVPGKRPEASWENALKASNDTERYHMPSPSTHNPVFPTTKQAHPSLPHTYFPYFMPTPINNIPAIPPLFNPKS